MTKAKVYIFGSGEHARSLIRWLQVADLSSRDVASVFDYPELIERTEADCDGIPTLSFESVRALVHPDDIVLVVSKRFSDAVGDLLALGVRHIIDGHAALASSSRTSKLLKLTADFRAREYPATVEDREERSFQRYVAPPADIHSLRGRLTFIVNSMPKSGSVWMMAMLERILGAQSTHTVSLSHVLDVESDLERSDVHGVVVLVRDMRDVVVSWFHHLVRLDAQNGFASPRYPTVEEFYFDHFIGEIHSNARYGRGDLESWLNLAGARGFPVVRYEQLVADTAMALGKVMNFWKLRVPEEELLQVARDCRFENMTRSGVGQSAFVADQLKAGHLRRGKAGGWKDELPESVIADIDRRFAGYQRRLSYL